MNWTEQAQEMMQSWTQTQKKLWESWMGAATKASPVPLGWGNWLPGWQQMARETVEACTARAGAVPREVVDRLFVGEQAYLRFIEFAVDAFRSLAPGIEAGEDWAVLLRRYIGQLKEEMIRAPAPWITPEGAAAVAQDLPELWKLFVAEARKLGLPWIQSIQEARGHLGDAMSGDRQASIKMFNLFLDTFETSLGKLWVAPAIGYTREFQEKVTKAFETWVDVRRAEVEFQTEIFNIGFKALENLVRELVEKGEKGEKITSYRQLFDLWVSSGEKTYFEVASTEAFAETQGRLVNAAMHYRVHERELAEEFLQAIHLPTRRELDDAYRHLHDLRIEVKALRKELKHLRNETRKAEVRAAEETPASKLTRPGAPKEAAAKPRTGKASSSSRKKSSQTKKEG